MNTILIVEDNKFFSDIYEIKLNKAGYDTVRYSDPYSAMEYISEGNLPKAIILDVLLPGVNGLALIHELQTYVDTRDIPVLICSSIADKFDNNIISDYGIKALLDKNTMKPEDILYTVRNVLKDDKTN